MVPLVEPIGRYSKGYPSSWPDNIAGETPHSAMGNEITALVRADSGRDFVSVQGEVGENGQCMIYLRKNPEQKGVNGRSYEAALIETKAITRLAKAAGKTYGVGAIIVTHGECDAGNPNYENDLYQLWSDYNTDLPAITGQKQKIQMIVSQQNSCNDRSASTLAQWKIGVDHPADIVCSGPKYQYPSHEGIHLTAEGYRRTRREIRADLFRAGDSRPGLAAAATHRCGTEWRGHHRSLSCAGAAPGLGNRFSVAAPVHRGMEKRQGI